MHRLAVSTVAFKTSEEAIRFYKSTGIPLEYGVNFTQREIEDLLSHKVKCSSVHVPSPKERFFPNFASRDKEIYTESMEILKRSMDTLSSCGGDTLVIHPGYAIDALVPSDFKERKPFIEKGVEEFKGFIIDKDGALTGPEYLNFSVYKSHFQAFWENIPEIVELVRSQGFYLTVENLNPRLYYVLQLPDEVKALSKVSPHIRFCLDLGHLFISSLVNGFDFIHGIKDILATKKVIHFHLSNNPSSSGYYDDAHDHITSGNIDYDRVLPLIKDIDANFIIEIKKDPTEDIAFLEERLTNLG